MTSPTSANRRAYTLLEMLTTVALLAIVLGLTVSLARHVRAESAESLTKSLLQRLEGVMSEYYGSNGGAAPAVTPLIDPGQEAPVDEAALQARALRNNQEFLAALRSAGLEGRLRSQVPASAFDATDQALLDGWGKPIVFMAAMNPVVGMAPLDRFFFFSAGPDRRYLTRTDNLYSYEGSAAP